MQTSSSNCFHSFQVLLQEKDTVITVRSKLFNCTLTAKKKERVNYKDVPTHHIYILSTILSKDAFRILSGYLSKTVHYRNGNVVPPTLNIYMKNKMHIKMAEKKQLENFHRCTTSNLKTQNAKLKHILQWLPNLLKTCNWKLSEMLLRMAGAQALSHHPEQVTASFCHVFSGTIQSQSPSIVKTWSQGPFLATPALPYKGGVPQIKTGSWPSVGVPSTPQPHCQRRELT